MSRRTIRTASEGIGWDEKTFEEEEEEVERGKTGNGRAISAKLLWEALFPFLPVRAPPLSTPELAQREEGPPKRKKARGLVFPTKRELSLTKGLRCLFDSSFSSRH